MNRYQASTPRVAAAIAAVVMTLITIGVTIIVPATIESSAEGVRSLAAHQLSPAPAFVGLSLRRSALGTALASAAIPTLHAYPQFTDHPDWS